DPPVSGRRGRGPASEHSQIECNVSHSVKSKFASTTSPTPTVPGSFQINLSIRPFSTSFLPSIKCQLSE
ncbi:hypothetical protein BGZ52_001029, partial [Haplosporangium bisporale]